MGKSRSTGNLVSENLLHIDIGTNNIGIGTTNPDEKLHIDGNIKVTGAYYDSNNNSGTSGYVLKSTATGTDWVDPTTVAGLQGTTGTQGTTGAQGTIGSQGTSGPSTTINASNDTSTTTLYPVMVGATGSNQTAKARSSATAFSFNASTNTLSVANASVTGIIQDAGGNVRSLPNNAQSTSYTLTINDIGELINITTGGVTVPASVFSAGNSVTIYNNSGSSQTITQGASTTLRLAGTDLTGNRTLAQRGITTITCVASNEFVISGAGLS